ncbi:hypothetical protein OY671_011263, partial [Metschnikowia pulcherrima]
RTIARRRFLTDQGQRCLAYRPHGGAASAGPARPFAFCPVSHQLPQRRRFRGARGRQGVGVPGGFDRDGGGGASPFAIRADRALVLRCGILCPVAERPGRTGERKGVALYHQRWRREDLRAGSDRKSGDRAGAGSGKLGVLHLEPHDWRAARPVRR